MFYGKTSKVFLFAMILAGAAASSAAPARALQDDTAPIPSGIGDEIGPGGANLEMIPGSPVSYCHKKFPAIDEKTLGGSNPRLKDDGDMVDFYGPCDHDPLGDEEVAKQKREEEFGRARDSGGGGD